MHFASRPKQLLASFAMVFAIPATALAQGTILSGQVVSASGSQPLAAAQVSIEALRVGGQTDAQGRYSFTVPSANVNGQTVTLVARRLGFSPSTAQVRLTGNSIITDFRLASVATELTGVVVTALGVQREKSQLGTAQQQLSTGELNETKTMNVINSIQGKVSGVNITGSGTQGGSNRIVLRGANSISGNNSPLFVVDGVPVSNASRGAVPSGGFDFGSAIADINPEDIATMTVLKGPNAAALYGSRAANGVIIMTTKKGRVSGRMRTELSTNFTWETPSILPEYQNLYGQGSAGEFEYVDGQGGGTQDYNDQSFGPRLDGRLIDQFTGPAQPWVAHPDNVKSFFNTGHTLSNTIAFSGGTERATARISFGSDQTEGYVPNNTFHKTNASLNATLQINKRLSTDASLQYARNTGSNRPGVGYTHSIMEQFVWFGRQVDLEALRNYKQGGAINSGPADREYNWNYSFHNNPFWIQYENPQVDTRDRIIGSLSATYNLAEGIDGTVRTGSDIYRYNIDQRFAPGDSRQNTIVDPKFFGGFTQINDYNNENTTDATLRANRMLGTRLQFNVIAGAATRRSTYNFNSAQTGGLTVPGIYNVSNAAITPTLGQSLQRRQVNSVYGSTDITLNGWWTVGATARNDWSSTLPEGENSYFYPSINTAFVLTDALPGLKNRVLNYAKIRASTAQVGSDADPYQLRTTYTGLSTKYNGLAQFTLGDALANGALKPEITHSNEFGAELSLFDGRITFDGSIYDKYTKNQIFNAPVSQTTGFTSKSINAGKITNKGHEFLLSVIPVQMDNGFAWNSTFNYGRNKSRITELAPGVSTLLLGSLFSARVEARLDLPYGAIMGRNWARDDKGNLMLRNGLPYRESTAPTHYFGSVQPQWTGGWGNTFTFGPVKLYGLLDFKKGGKIASITNMWGTYTGIFPSTLQGREDDWDKPGIIAAGTDVVTGQPNTVRVDAETYWQCRAYNCGQVIEDYVYDASYTKLRELSVSYEVPRTWAGRLNASGITLALTGRNLMTWTSVPNIDPEFSYQTGNNQGIEFAALPNAKVWGFNVRITP